MKNDGLTLGNRIADAVTALVGSWYFIGWQSFFLALWIIINAIGWVGWDIYPFILLNLVLSFQAAYATPFILMSQNRQAEIDRATSLEDLRIDSQELEEIKALRIEIKALVAKMSTLDQTSVL